MLGHLVGSWAKGTCTPGEITVWPITTCPKKTTKAEWGRAQLRPIPRGAFLGRHCALAFQSRKYWIEHLDWGGRGCSVWLCASREHTPRQKGFKGLVVPGTALERRPTMPAPIQRIKLGLALSVGLWSWESWKVFSKSYPQQLTHCGFSSIGRQIRCTGTQLIIGSPELMSLTTFSVVLNRWSQEDEQVEPSTGND